MNSSDVLNSALQELNTLGVEIPQGRLTLDSYGDSPELERELLELIKSGSKTASASLAWAYDAERREMPKPGDVAIVVNSQGRPKLVTQIESVELLPFSEVSSEHAALEGEGDKSLAYWRETHWQFFSRECARIGKVASPEMPVVCARFKVMNVVSSSPAA
ncbi:ASCH domain-containing protein [Halomonas caseinilytica]|uniref:ASCH domain-containing protein n=1 Tax=Halomonas caseinilytica TaxID=438744 RepID=UPI000945D495|nr:ASCH domain-containing protein [Halomonas caseinilytica]